MALAHAILASLLDQPQTGYDLAKQFGSDGFFWRATHQQIYRELSKLEAEGAIGPVDELPGARGERKLMATALGRAALVQWVSQPSAPATIKEDILVKCLSLGIIDPKDLITEIARNRDQHDLRRQHHEKLLSDQFAHGPPSDSRLLGRYLALLAGITYEQGWIDWAEVAMRLAKEVA